MTPFYLFAAIAVGASLLVIAQRNPVYSVLLLIASFGALSGLYVLLDAPVVAVARRLSRAVGGAVRDRRGRRLRATQPDHDPAVDRDHAERGEPDVRRVRPRAGIGRRSDHRLLRHDRRRGGSGRRPGHCHHPVPSPRVAQPRFVHGAQVVRRYAAVVTRAELTNHGDTKAPSASGRRRREAPRRPHRRSRSARAPFSRLWASVSLALIDLCALDHLCVDIATS